MRSESGERMRLLQVRMNLGRGSGTAGVQTAFVSPSEVP